MRLRSIKLRGFKGIFAGIGVDEIYIDFDKLPLGLIAITGLNGKGKTTLMDNLHPYRIMPYKLRKSKDYTPGAFSYYDQCYGPDAVKDLMFDHDGMEYRSLILIDADRKKQEAYLYVRKNGSWQPLNDGKTRTYDEIIDTIFGKPALFFTSAFRAQGAKNLSDCTRGDIVGIIAELLNVNHIKEQGEKARQVIEKLESVEAIYGAKLGAIEADLSSLKSLQQELRAIEGTISTIQFDIASKNHEIKRIMSDIDNAEKKRVIQESELNRLNDLVNEQSRDQIELDTLNKETEESVGKLDRELKALEAEHNAIVNRYETAINRLNDLIARNNMVISNATTIRTKVAEEETVKTEMDLLKVSLEHMESSKTDLTASYLKFNALRQERIKAEADLTIAVNIHQSVIKQVENEIIQNQREADKLNGLDCNGNKNGWVNDRCRFIADAVAAKNRLPELHANLEQVMREDELISIRQCIDSLVANEYKYSEVEYELSTISMEIDILKEKIRRADSTLTELSPWVKMVAELDQAEFSKKQLQVDLTEKESEYAAALDAIALKIAQVEENKVSIRSNSEKKAASCSKNMADREQIISWLRCSTGEEVTVTTLKNRKDLITTEIGSQETVLSNKLVSAGVTRSRISELKVKTGEETTIRERLSRIKQEITVWRVLAKAFSNDGIIALEIDDAGPGIAAIANDLLSACYGPRFSVRFETQSIKNNGEMKEDFDITVLDAETDEQKSIKDMSGGQITWLEDAIKRAICLYNISRSGRHYETIFSDEIDGALDANKKLEYLAIKRTAMKIGTHTREIFISQTHELTELADARITLTHGEVVLH